MDTLRWLFQSGPDDQWSELAAGAVTLTLSVIVVYQGLSWIKRKYVIATSKNDHEVIMKPPGGVDPRRQSRILPGPGRVRASVLADGAEFLMTLDPGVTTVYENFLRGMRLSGDGPCLGHRSSATEPFQWLTYGQVLDQARRFGAGLVELGLSLGKESFVGIYARNCPDWVIANLACMSYSAAVVPLYDTLGLDAVHFIVGRADIDVVVCDSYEKADKLLSCPTRLPKHVVFARGVDSSSPSAARVRRLAGANSVQLHDFDDVVASGERRPHPQNPPRPEDAYMICYTSGTTGSPKGVVLTHRNVVCNAASGLRLFEEYGVRLHPGEAVISYLPLAHMFEQMVHFNVLYHGGKIGFFRGDINGLADDARALRPTYLPAVPRLLNRLYDKVQSTLAGSPVQRFLFEWALRRKLSEMRRGVIRRNSVWDRLVFNKIQAGLGGNVRIVITGSAPIRDEVLTTIRAMLGCLVLEAYGQTECTAAATATFPFDFTSGHVGGPLPCCHIKVVDVPELEYSASNDEGEICVRGPCVTSGYFRDPARTAEILDDEGWLHTGDVGRWLPNGALKIIDRKKHIFKLAQGEYVAPEKIENVYGRSPLVSQVFVDGNSLQRFLVAVVVPDEGRWERFAESRGVVGDPYSNRELVAQFLAELNAVGRKMGLSSLELVKAVHLSKEPFSIDNGLLTPTLKLKRPQLRKHFASTIEHLYARANE